MIENIIKNYPDFNFTSNIKQNDLYTENIKENKSYKSLVECIISKYDTMYRCIPENEKNLYLENKIIEISSFIDEFPSDYYDKFKFNDKIMKKSTIQYSLMNSYKNKVNSVSSLIFLGELFNTNFCIVVNNEYYESLYKFYNKDFIIYSNNNYSFTNNVNYKYKSNIDNFKFVIDDIGKSYINIYKISLNSISKYKLDDLINMCKNNNISIVDDFNKKKKKSELYNEIRLYLLNN